MRLSLFASLAALSAASDSSFDDDDLNFLRLLSSNATGNTTATTAAPVANTTVAPANTTAAPANTTVAPATTVAANTTAAPANTTAAATTVAATTVAATTVAATTVAANTTVAAETTVASVETTTVAPVEETTVAQEKQTTVAATTAAPATTLCVAANYATVGLTPPTTIEANSNVIGIDCTSKPSFNSSATSMYFFGTASQTAENKAKCGTTATDLTCGTEATLSWWNSLPAGEPAKAGVLAYCCGYPANFGSSTLAGTPSEGGSLTMGRYSDNTCTTPLAATDFTDTLLYGGDTKETTLAFGTCLDIGYPFGDMAGVGTKLIASNGTGTGSHYLQGFYFDLGCASLMMTSVNDQQDCKNNARRRGLQEGNATSAPADFEKSVVTGASEIADLEILSDNTMSFPTFATAPSAAEAATFVSTVSEAVRVAVADASGAATTIESSIGYGQLAASSRRRRQLTGHGGGNSVATVTKTVVAAAQAATVQNTMDTAASSGALDSTTLATAVVTALQAETSLASVATNLTASSVSSTIAVSAPTIPAPAPGGAPAGSSTSAASSGALLSFAAGAVLCLSTALLM